MVDLKTQDRNKLLSILNDIPVLSSYRGRVQVLKSAGLGEFQARIDLEGKPRLVIAEMVDELVSYGRLTYDREALGQFLNAVKQEIGSGDLDRLRFLDHLLTKYRMMTPIALSPSPVEWIAGSDEDDVLEKVIGENTLRPIAFLREGLEIAKSVALVLISGVRSGTGFLIAPNLLITNHHVLPEMDDAQKAVFRFNYQDDITGQPEPYFDHRATVNGRLCASAKLDYAIVELDGNLGIQWGFLPLERRRIKRDGRVNIIQHPAGMPKQISIQNNFVRYADDRVIQYVTTTMAGSSGAPVLDDQWRVVALHHAGGLLPEPQTGHRYFRNQGIAINAILSDLPATIRQSLEK